MQACSTHSVGCSIDTSSFEEAVVPKSMQSHNCESIFNSPCCPHCQAYLWVGERASLCCCKGKVSLDLLQQPPSELIALFDVNRLGNTFLEHIRAYNNALALASLGCNQVCMPGFSPNFKIQGKMFHRIGSLLPAENQAPKFAQLFFYDSDNELANRLSHHSDLDPDILGQLQRVLHANNSYIQSFKAAVELECQEDVKIVLHADKRLKPTNEHCRRYNLPVQTEVAALLPGESHSNLDVIVSCRDGTLQRVNTVHRSYDPLHYVLLFPEGTDGWQLGLKRTDNRTLSALDFYSHRLQVRHNDFNIIMKSRRLMQQYAVDQWAKIESSRMQWVKSNQKTIRAEKYQGLYDAIMEGEMVNVGRKVILPPTIYGSPRFYSEAFMDAMTIVRKFGKPDYFITFTTNPKWPEIQASLFLGEAPHDRPDLACRVFKLKYDSLMDDLLKKNVLGKVKAHTATIEWQKRGLTHAHILLLMEDQDKPKTPEKIDRVVSAEIPDPAINPKLYEVVTINNIHGPCGHININSPCMEGREQRRHCTKNFPKPCRTTTVVLDDSYPQYRRRSPKDGGRTVIKRIKGEDVTVDNSFVVPYNPFLSLRYKAHINVEVVYSVQAVKYLYKYITKGQDRIIMTIRDEENGTSHVEDEVENYMNARYISASEALWKIYGFPIHEKHPPVEKLPCHLPNQQQVLFEEHQVAQVVQQGPPVTKLTAYFDANAQDPSARHILYPDFPHFFTWNSKDKKWQRRKRGIYSEATNQFMGDMLGRIPSITLNPHQAELYYLRMLLHNKAGAVSFDDLRTVNDHTCRTFQEACQRLGLLEDDGEMDKAMEEAAAIRFGPALRDTFVTILLYCRPANPLQFWETHKVALCTDLMQRDKASTPTEAIINEVLLSLQDSLERQGLDVHEDFGLPKPPPMSSLQNTTPRIIEEETNYDTSYLQGKVTEQCRTLNEQQQHVFDVVMDSVNSSKGKVFCLNACGGSGKTYTINLLLAAVRAQGGIALGTALSGITATLLDNGPTLHSRFKVPIKIKETSMCSITKREALSELLKQAKLLVIDEVTMGHRHIFEAVDRTMRDIRENDALFGGLTVLFAGDWRQILPVIRHAGRPQIVEACLKHSPIWDAVEKLELSENMRVKNSPGDSASFAEFLLKVGNGKLDIVKDLGPCKVRLPDGLMMDSGNLEDLCQFVFQSLEHKFTDPVWLCSRAIICPTNSAVAEINDVMINRFPGEARKYKSRDKVLENEHQYPLEFINSLTPSGFPPHVLNLKKHASIVLIRNLRPHDGHVNGCRYAIQALHDNVIEAVMATGPHAGQFLIIPRIPFVLGEDDVFPFQMQRRQFPIRLAFGITCNKSQGQSLSTCGIHLDRPFFSNGQLYVALSRVENPENMRIMARNAHFDGYEGYYTDNVVFSEVL